MKVLLVAFLAMLCVFAAGNPLKRRADPVVETIDFLKGFFKGALEDQSVEIETCIGDVSAIVTVIEKIIADVENNVFSHLEDLFLDFIDLLADIPISVQQCEISEEELAIFLQWAEQLKDVKAMGSKFFTAFLRFPDRLRDDFKNAIEDFKAQDFNGSGFSIGDILNVLFVQIKTVNSAEDAAVFLKSYYKAAFSIALQLDDCKASVGTSWDDLVAAVDLIRHGSIEAGVAALVKALPEVFTSFQTCKAAWPQIEQGLEQLRTFINHPASIIVAISEAVVMDPISFPKDAYNVYNAFTAVPPNYNLGGQASGDITKMVIKYMPHD